MLSYFPPAAPAVTAVNAAATATKAIVGEKKYENIRSKTIGTLSIIDGFSPISPTLILFPIKLAIFIIVILVCIYVFHLSPLRSTIFAYLFQAVIIMLLSGWLSDKLLKLGFGI